MAERMWTPRLRDGGGAETRRNYMSRKSAVAAGRRAERHGKAVWWEASPTYVDPAPAEQRPNDSSPTPAARGDQ